jgi:hypothetical protein
MFNQLAIKLLIRESARLRSELRAANRRYDELLDRTLFSVRPERVVHPRGNGTPEFTPSDDAGDMYTKAMQDAERLAKAAIAPDEEPEDDHPTATEGRPSR